MKLKYVKPALVIFCLLIVTTSCKKYLDKKANESLTIPSTLLDIQALLDNGSANVGMKLTCVGTDEYYLLSPYWANQNKNIITKQGYIWGDDIKLELNQSDWVIQYRGLLDVNTALDYLSKITPKEQGEKWNSLKGSALFYRARIFYDLAQVYSQPYSEATATTDMGISLRLTSDFNKFTTRSTVKEAYDQILKDLEESSQLLPTVTPSTPLYKFRPTKAAVFALLAKVYLTMGNYIKAKQNAGACLQEYNSLLNYNIDINTSSGYPFPLYNKEVIFLTKVQAVNGFSSARADSNLYCLYDSNDVRKKAFFGLNSDGTFNYRGSYNGSFELFTGLATDEMYLIRSEANARLNVIADAMQDLNTLLQTRWKAGTYVPFSASTQDQALNIILKERKKELINRGVRWSDLRRLNIDSRFSVVLKRVINNQNYELQPNSLKYTWLIPQEVINLTNIPQNGR